jgi:cytochrome c
MKTWLAGVLVLAASADMAAAQDLTKGEASFKKCFACHDVGEKARVKLGPPLNGLEGRKAGTFEGFNYSDANKSSGIVWDEATFRKYIRNPQQEMKGTRMFFIGIKDEDEVTNLWAYLKQFGPDGKKK